jgi:hypothetical protein
MGRPGFRNSEQFQRSRTCWTGHHAAGALLIARFAKARLLDRFLSRETRKQSYPARDFLFGDFIEELRSEINASAFQPRTYAELKKLIKIGSESQKLFPREPHFTVTKRTSSEVRFKAEDIHGFRH